MMFIGQCIHDVAISHGLMISLFLAGLVGGTTHCVGMCAPFVFAQVNGQPGLIRLSSALLLPYHLGRMTTYITLAVLVTSIVNLAFVFSGLKSLVAAPMLMLAGVIFLVSAFPGLSGLFPWIGNIRITAPYKFITRLSSTLMNNPNIIKRYGLGILLGFMPCGLVVSALLTSATAPSPLEAGLAMGAFTIGTMPSLILVALSGQTLRVRYPKASAYATQGAMVISSFWLFVLAGTMIF